MGYDIQLVDEDGTPVQVKRHTHSGTFVLGGTTSADISITYNYAPLFTDTLDEKDGIRFLYGKTAEMCIPKLHAAVRELGTVRSDNYWSTCPGNAGHVLAILLSWAKDNPLAIFQGD